MNLWQAQILLWCATVLLCWCHIFLKPLDSQTVKYVKEPSEPLPREETQWLRKSKISTFTKFLSNDYMWGTYVTVEMLKNSASISLKHLKKIFPYQIESQHFIKYSFERPFTWIWKKGFIKMIGLVLTSIVFFNWSYVRTFSNIWWQDSFISYYKWLCRPFDSKRQLIKRLTTV